MDNYKILSKFRKVVETDRFKRDVEKAKEEIGDSDLIDEVLKAIRFDLERNAENCPMLRDTNVRFYKTRRVWGGHFFTVHLHLNDDEVKLCVLKWEKHPALT